ncbi:1-(5-phosphoribosyl)-5-[(5-phosphoribosylamino)methylideneamino]imidazole-4-carboxamide isomerase [Isachenkonia alkalipeptolytica]|uniref:1-(5-phosphoribosyl)-5-[(5-phosphoribosylamino)methylideneamino] imidazole-4-carboxamide isomerase n=1 Tax=Isachenkonia alkalipeptolytica TaxID=2565777 RepID=A0AA43XKG5_9CLOT|nr:1-(5-phosphoribosyl)-5-[(5-phosphoribosylamino)methylideneamino]imidazole-4-carboxamide isomerase [Isachenkonia alkalipeptolytica]NBG87515.1 1-(5-phosphoribosyl)-5-[(5-phosphoribosylamino)methylideneamino]imidazole-4-carboxamide isomerase [Isachenkonia alkalipeptolytica]
MILFPAIDILDGQCVRLRQGDYDLQSVYHKDPRIVAKQWQRAGAKALHIVDLNGAKEGSLKNLSVIEGIIKDTGLPLQFGGGVRNMKTLELLITLGVQRVILGTAALEDPEFLEEALQTFGDKIAVSIDTNKGFVALEGWLKISEVKGLDFARALEEKGLKTLVYTDILKDGMLQGPNFSMYRELAENTSLNIIASGGVSTPEDVKRLQDLGLYGAIVGRALYEDPKPFYPLF